MNETFLAVCILLVIICMAMSYRIGYKKGHRDGYVEGFDFRGRCVYGDWAD